jgi:hypothetical protein
LVHARNFILNEVEADRVELQNKVIGKNHTLSDPSFRYKAWYKAVNEIAIGYDVTPKTNKGDFVIESTGDITVYAGEVIHIESGFHIQSGGTFHAFIAYDGCVANKSASQFLSSTPNNSIEKHKHSGTLESIIESQELVVFPNPATGEFSIHLPDDFGIGTLIVYSLFGQIIHEQELMESNSYIELRNVSSGIYLIQVTQGKEMYLKKIIIK